MVACAGPADGNGHSAPFRVSDSGVHFVGSFDHQGIGEAVISVSGIFLGFELWV